MTNDRSKQDLKSALDSLANEILESPNEEILHLYKEAGISPDEGPNRIKTVLSEKLNSFRRQRIRTARQNNESSIKTGKSIAIPETYGEQRTLLEKLLSSPNIPEPLTVSFRDGKGIPDEDLKSILEDLADLGILEDEK